MIVAAASAASGGLAVADDKQDALTVLPWTDATLAFSSADKRATVSYTQSSGRGIGFHLKASASLDEDSHLAALTDTNHPIGGLTGSLQIGWDRRADYLSWLATQSKQLAEVYKQLVSLPRWASSGARARFIASIEGVFPQDGSNTAIARYFCKTLPADCSKLATTPQLVISKVLLKLCTGSLKKSCSDDVSFYSVANAYWNKHCSHPTTVECDIAGFGIDYLETTASFRIAERMLRDPVFIERVRDAYAQIAPDKAEELQKCILGGKPPAQCVIERAGPIAEALDTFVRTAPLQRRDFLLTAMRGRKQWDLALMLGASLSYDRSQIYQGDLASKPKPAAAYEFTIGPDITAYAPVDGLSLNARVGFERTRQLGATAVERCAGVESSDPLVAGKRCNTKALFRPGSAPAAESSAFVRLAIDYQYRGEVSNSKLIPGVELRGGLAGIGQTSLGELRFSLFGTPVSGSAAARVGVALDLRYSFCHEAAPGEPRLIVTPMVFIGGTLTDLMSN